VDPLSALTKPNERHDKPGTANPANGQANSQKKSQTPGKSFFLFYLRLFAWIWQYLTNRVGGSFYIALVLTLGQDYLWPSPDLRMASG